MLRWLRRPRRRALYLELLALRAERERIQAAVPAEMFDQIQPMLPRAVEKLAASWREKCRAVQYVSGIVNQRIMEDAADELRRSTDPDAVRSP